MADHDFKYEITVDSVYNELSLLTKPQYQNTAGEQYVARQIGMKIYELKHIHTNMTSKKLLVDGFRKKDGTNEHFWSRQRAGRDIIDHWRQGTLTREKLHELLIKYSHVHRVTAKENNRLASIQREHPDLPWEEQYAMAKVELVPDPGKPHQSFWKPCSIEGVSYKTILIAERETGIDRATIRERCASPSKKWAGWTRN